MQSAQDIVQTIQDQNCVICRICLEQCPKSSANKTMINPCQCRGSAQFVHSECIEKWIKESKKKIHKDKQNKNSKYVLCQLCTSPIYFKQQSQSWLSWYQRRPGSAVFYFCWLMLLILAFVGVVAIITIVIVTKQYLYMKFMGLPLGFTFFGGLLFLSCRRKLKDWEEDIIKVQHKKKKNKSSINSRIKQSGRSINIEN